MGHEVECRAHVAEALQLATQLGLGLCEVWATAALGELELVLGNSPAAVAAFERLDSFLRANGIGDVDLSPGPELVELHLRAGRRDAAAEVAESYAQRAALKGLPWALARSARAQGLVAPEPEIEACFERRAGPARTDAGRLRDRTNTPRVRQPVAPVPQAGSRTGAAALRDRLLRRLAGAAVVRDRPRRARSDRRDRSPP